MTLNLENAKEAGAKRVFCYCVGCAHLGKGFFSTGEIAVTYFLDILLDKMGKMDLWLEQRVGYFEGCHKMLTTYAPGVKFNWSAYRELLRRIKGLEAIDLDHRICCYERPDLIVDNAQKHNLNTIVCSCIGCCPPIRAAAGEEIQVKYLPAILQEALGAE
jgi:hypothetical protein